VFPADGVFLACFEAETGKVVWRQTIDVVASGPMVASADRLFVQSMRSPPSAFDLSSGKPLGPVEGGGSIAALWKDRVVSGPTLVQTHDFQFTVRDQSLYAATHEPSPRSPRT
jgi:outer membrane protein assembly factor BamB